MSLLYFSVALFIFFVAYFSMTDRLTFRVEKVWIRLAIATLIGLFWLPILAFIFFAKFTLYVLNLIEEASK